MNCSDSLKSEDFGEVWSQVIRSEPGLGTACAIHLACMAPTAGGLIIEAGFSGFALDSLDPENLCVFWVIYHSHIINMSIELVI